jgi:hypothetical protein
MVTTRRILVHDIKQWNRILNDSQTQPCVRRLGVHLSASGQVPAPETDKVKTTDSTEAEDGDEYWEERKAEKLWQTVADEDDVLQCIDTSSMYNT